MIDITPDQHQIVTTILAHHLHPSCTVWAFGSRVNQTAQSYSDLDLALACHTYIAHDTLFQLKQSFRESRLPFTVDIVDMNTAPDYFKAIINKQKIKLCVYPQ